MGGIKDKIAKALSVGFLRLGTRNRMLKKQAQDLLSATPRVPDSSAIAGDVGFQVLKTTHVRMSPIRTSLGFLQWGHSTRSGEGGSLKGALLTPATMTTRRGNTCSRTACCVTLLQTPGSRKKGPFVAPRDSACATSHDGSYVESPGPRQNRHCRAWGYARSRLNVDLRTSM